MDFSIRQQGQLVNHMGEEKNPIKSLSNGNISPYK